jgi:CRISPR-associated protein Csx14
MIKPQTTFVCTLGGQPQIVTLTLDLLLARGEQIEQVIVMYLVANPRYAQAFQRLSGEFAGDRYGARPCRLRGVPIHLGRHTLAEVRLPAEVDAVWKTFSTILADLKAQAHQVHLSLTGGRRMMALLAISVAMLHFTPTDHAWHLYTPPELLALVRDGALMHAPPDTGAHLIEVPLAPWGAYFPGLRGLLNQSPAARRLAQGSGLDEADRTRCGQVWEGLSPRKRETLRALCTTATRAQAAEVLSVSVSTVDDHKTEILQRCRGAWTLEAERLDLAFLRQHFGRFLQEVDDSLS